MFGKKLSPTARLSAGLALAGATLALAVVAARADPYTPYGEPAASSVEGVTVYAPYRYVRHPTTGAIVRMNTVSLAVSLSDLDLSRPGDARIAKARIVEAAKDVCQRAEDVYPGSGEPPGGCYSMAVHDALRQAQDQAGYPIVAWGYR
jgi:UrcA family protein